MILRIDFVSGPCVFFRHYTSNLFMLCISFLWRERMIQAIRWARRLCFIVKVYDYMMKVMSN